MTLVSLRFHSYYGNSREMRADAPATVRGDIAVHRWGMVQPDGTLSLSKKYWCVSHIPTGASMDRALPLRLRTRAKRADLVAWAEAIQAACPAFFDLARKPGWYTTEDQDTKREAAEQFIAASKES